MASGLPSPSKSAVYSTPTIAGEDCQRRLECCRRLSAKKSSTNELGSVTLGMVTSTTSSLPSPLKSATATLLKAKLTLISNQPCTIVREREVEAGVPDSPVPKWQDPQGGLETADRQQIDIAILVEIAGGQTAGQIVGKRCRGRSFERAVGYAEENRDVARAGVSDGASGMPSPLKSPVAAATGACEAGWRLPRQN